MTNTSFKLLSEDNMQDVKDIFDLSFSHPWSLDALKKEIDNKNAYYTVLYSDDKIVGFGGIWVLFDESTIINIAVHPDFRANGFGNLILEDLITKSKELGASSMTLEVRVSNDKAVNLYKKYNFIIEGTRKNFYSDPIEDGHIMWKYNL